jgi:hypothetical protein
LVGRHSRGGREGAVSVGVGGSLGGDSYGADVSLGGGLGAGVDLASGLGADVGLGR